MYLPILKLVECCGLFIIVVLGQFNINLFIATVGGSAAPSFKCSQN
jgi:hypothetical protein